MSRENRTISIINWIRTIMSDKVHAQRTASVLAALCSSDLGFTVSANRMCRELRKERIPFTPSPNDPPERSYSKVDLLKARMDHLEENVKELQKTVKALEKKLSK